MANTDRFCTSCGSCRIGTVDPYTGEVLVEVEILAIPDDVSVEHDEHSRRLDNLLTLEPAS